MSSQLIGSKRQVHRMQNGSHNPTVDAQTPCC
jgi:hypothetical protein